MILLTPLRVLWLLLKRGAVAAYNKKGAALYALFFILMFATTYKLMGMKKHFSMPEDLKGKEDSWFTSVFTSVLAQSNAMPDTWPQTTAARVVFMLQVVTGWAWFLLFV